MPGWEAGIFISTSGLIEWSSFRVNSTGAVTFWEAYQYKIGRPVGQAGAFRGEHAEDQSTIRFASVGAADSGGGRTTQRRSVNGRLTDGGRCWRGLGGGFRSRVIDRGCVCAWLGVAKIGSARARPTSRDIGSLFMMERL